VFIVAITPVLISITFNAKIRHDPAKLLPTITLMRGCHHLTQLHVPLIQTNNQQAEQSRLPPFSSDMSFASSSDAWADRSLDFNLLGRLQATRNAERQHGSIPRRHSKQQPITLLSVSSHPSALRKRQDETYHSKAANPTAALATLHTFPKQTRLDKNTASATNPPNQNVMVRASTPRMANLCAKRGTLAGTMTTLARA
jgi:hypothetical protein